MDDDDMADIFTFEMNRASNIKPHTNENYQNEPQNPKKKKKSDVIGEDERKSFPAARISIELNKFQTDWPMTDCYIR